MQNSVDDLFGPDPVPEAPKTALAPAPCIRESHEAFAQALARHSNKVAAYQEAFPTCAPSTARGEAYRLAIRPDVARRVLELVNLRREALLAETADLESLVSNLCRGQATRLVDEAGNPIPLHMLPIEVQNAIKGLKLRVIRDIAGNVSTEYDVQFPDPLQALRLLAQLRGKLVDRHDLTSGGKPIEPVDTRSMPELQAELMKRLVGPQQPQEGPKSDDTADLL